MPLGKWKQLRSPVPDREYLALLTFLPLKRYRTLPRFGKYSDQIQHQLARAEGVLGYAVGSNILRLHFWTLSVWENEAALQTFVHSGEHLDVMKSLQGEMGETKFVRWKILGKEIPPSWEDAFGR
jgi:quinol monooxygenase YgiN